MAMLGKCLTFYLRYLAEMERLYWQRSETGEEPDMEGLELGENAEHVRHMIQTVGDTACREAAEFLETCAEEIESHFERIAMWKRVKSRVKKDWRLAYGLSAIGDSSAKFQLGFYIDKSMLAIVPWVWCKGGRRAEDAIASILGNKFNTFKEPESDSGTVALARIDLPKETTSLDVDRDPLVTRVQQTFAALTDAHVRALADLS